MSNTPALDYLLSPDSNGGRPSGCSQCELSRGISDEDHEPPNRDEGHFECLLLGPDEVSRRNDNPKCWSYRDRDVWGENPLCTAEDWKAKAREELAKINGVSA